MDRTILTSYLIYAVMGTSIIWWVTRKLSAHGVTFVRAGDRYDDTTAPAITELLIVGFCLVATGVVCLALGMGSRIATVQDCIEQISSRMGWTVMIIGMMHLVMVSVFASMGRGSRSRSATHDETHFRG